MTTRRDLLAALAALAATPAVARAVTATVFEGLDKAAVQRIGKAWREQNPGATARSLAARLFPSGRGPDALPRLRAAAAADFRKGAVFAYCGWRLSDTEGALMGLLALEGQP